MFLLAAFIFSIINLSVSFTIQSNSKYWMNKFCSVNCEQKKGKYTVDAERSTLSMVASREANGMISFSSRLPIVVNLPTRDVEQAQTFLSKTDLIVESTWESGKLAKISDGKYLFQFPTIALPGFDSITPAVEVQFSYLSSDSSIRMSSGQWSLGGTGKGIKDSRFMEVSQWLGFLS